MNIIEHIIEPTVLYLYWQSPSHNRWKVATLTKTADNSIQLNYLRDSVDYEKALADGFKGYTAYDFNTPEHNDVLDVFLRRLPPRSRLDFKDFLTALRLPAGVEISDFALLGYSGAKLPSDDFLIVHPFENISGPCELLVNIAGFRHYVGLEMLHREIQEGTIVHLKTEPENQYDAKAIAVYFGTERIGYVTRGLLPAMHSWILNGRIQSTTVERINGTPEKREVYLFLKISG